MKVGATVLLEKCFISRFLDIWMFDINTHIHLF